MPLNPNDKLATLREYERIHLKDMEDAALRGHEILMREIYSLKSERIKRFADTLAERIDLKDPMLDIDDKKQISGYIRRKYIELEVPTTIANQINKELPEEYKRPYKESEIEITDGSGLISKTTNSVDEIRKKDNLRLQEEDEKLATEEKDLKAKLARVRDVQAIVHEEAAERHLSLPSMRSQVISTPQPGEQTTEFAEELSELANCITEISRKATQFPPDSKDAARYAKAVRTYIKILRPLTDLKFTKGTREWLNTARKEDIMGKHGAAVKSSARAAITGQERALTREQVGDKKEQVFEQAIEILNSEYFLEVMEDWHDRYVEPYVAQRKVNLHDTLSEKA